MRTFNIPAGIAFCVTMSALPAWAAYTSDDSNVVVVPDISSFQTFGENMVGMDVTVHFSGGPSETATWGLDAGPGGLASGPSGWVLENRNMPGHTFTSPWELSYPGSAKGAITGLTLSGFAAFNNGAPVETAVAFDRDQFDSGALIGIGTPGSAQGLNLQSFSYAVDVKYSDPVDSQADGPGILRDLYGTLDIAFKERIESKWTQRPPTQGGVNIHSDVDWRTVMEQQTRQVVADDFVSDGRPILGVRWWGSYFDQEKQPKQDPLTGGWLPQEEEGFLISFFNNAAATASVPGTLAGSYIAPVETVAIQPTPIIGFDGHRVWQYEVLLEETLLDHAGPLASEEGFLEISGDEYWISIAAESGHRIDPASGEEVDTNEPREQEPFWGWHTSFDGNALPNFVDNNPVAGLLEMPGDAWRYEWLSSLNAENMAFELLTTVPGSTFDQGTWSFVQDADNPANPVPEPSTIGLLALVGLIVCVRTRRH